MNQDCVVPILTPEIVSDDIMIERITSHQYEKNEANFYCITLGVCMFIGGIPLLLSYIFYLSS